MLLVADRSANVLVAHPLPELECLLVPALAAVIGGEAS
jgi:hypothetical protein